MPEAYLESAFPKAQKKSFSRPLERLKGSSSLTAARAEAAVQAPFDVSKWVPARKGRPKAVRERVEEEEEELATPQAQGSSKDTFERLGTSRAQGGQGDLGQFPGVANALLSTLKTSG